MAIEAAEAAGSFASAVATLGDNHGALAIAEPRWAAMDGVPGAEKAQVRLAASLASACMGLGRFELVADYVDRAILMAEAVHDAEALSAFFRLSGARFQALGAPITAAAHYRGSAEIARQFDLPNALAGALINQVSLAFGRDLDAALTVGRTAIDASRRSGVQSNLDMATCNYLLSLWTAGRLAEAQELYPVAAENIVELGGQYMLAAFHQWLDRAVGRPSSPAEGPDLNDQGPSDDQYVLAWTGHLRMADALDRADFGVAARIAEATLPHVLAAMGLEDEFVYMWPPLVEAALAAGNAELAEQLMEPVTSAAPDVVAPHVAAHCDRLRGLVRATRGEDPATVEADLRAGVAGLSSFGAVGDAARAEEELARWLISQGRAGEAEALLGEVRATYSRIGAAGWLAALDGALASTS
jgi:tetratricopeptide (TPR) repeat protein